MQKFSRWRAFIPLTKFSSLNLFYQVLPFFLLVGLFSCTNGKPGHMNLQNLHIGVTLTPIRKIKPAQDNQTTVYIQGKIQKVLLFFASSTGLKSLFVIMFHLFM